MIKINEITDDFAMSLVESYMFTFSNMLNIDEIISIFIENNIVVNKKYVKNIIEKLCEKYNMDSSGLEIIKIEDRYQLVTKKQNFTYLEKVVSKIKKKSLTSSAIETLTIIAYNQPATKGLVEKIKGVKSDTTISKLLEEELIQECGRLDKVGRPMQYKTTDKFLKHLGIRSLKELPSIKQSVDITIS